MKNSSRPPETTKNPRDSKNTLSADQKTDEDRKGFREAGCCRGGEGGGRKKKKKIRSQTKPFKKKSLAKPPSVFWTSRFGLSPQAGASPPLYINLLSPSPLFYLILIPLIPPLNHSESSFFSPSTSRFRHPTPFQHLFPIAARHVVPKSIHNLQVPVSYRQLSLHLIRVAFLLSEGHRLTYFPRFDVPESGGVKRSRRINAAVQRQLDLTRVRSGDLEATGDEGPARDAPRQSIVNCGAWKRCLSSLTRKLRGLQGG
ncbi:hypothetical protein H6P81_011515 [Aristolochia fimbriata]|uniref:Uncharacterized protein n=1 Tax=Aristolochia fimbriata TaxID=158543 RepID=A0AAV7ERP4_ARIFI|nr:hypothetical protein H6P81_011515 [Aristolochia fimbriata]